MKYVKKEILQNSFYLWRRGDLLFASGHSILQFSIPILLHFAMFVFWNNLIRFFNEVLFCIFHT